MLKRYDIEPGCQWLSKTDEGGYISISELRKVLQSDELYYKLADDVGLGYSAAKLLGEKLPEILEVDR